MRLVFTGQPTIRSDGLVLGARHLVVARSRRASAGMTGCNSGIAQLAVVETAVAAQALGAHRGPGRRRRAIPPSGRAASLPGPSPGQVATQSRCMSTSLRSPGANSTRSPLPGRQHPTAGIQRADLEAHRAADGSGHLQREAAGKTDDPVAVAVVRELVAAPILARFDRHQAPGRPARSGWPPDRCSPPGWCRCPCVCRRRSAAPVPTSAEGRQTQRHRRWGRRATRR